MAKPKEAAKKQHAEQDRKQQANSSKAKQDKSKGDDDADLLKDVRAFASSLGFSGAPAAAGDDGAFAEFSAAYANKPINSTQKLHDNKARQPAAKQQPAGRQDEQKAKGQAGLHKAHAVAGKPQATVGQQKQEQHDKPHSGKKQSSAQGEEIQDAAAAAKPAGREWNFGAGPRPGEKQGKSLLGKEDPAIWYQAAAALPVLPPTTEQLSDEEIEKVRAQCEQLLESEAAAFERDMQRRNMADYKWLQQVKKSGTTADKVAAITLQVQESAFAGVKSLDTLLSWVSRSKGGRDLVRQAIDALQELFINVLLPDRRLRSLEQQPLAALPDGKDAAKHLLYWYLEDQIKVRYSLFITALEECSRDNLEFVKEKSIKTMYELLVKKPEGEGKLLTALVNKLGDPSRKLASKSGYLLTQVLLAHPAMKPVVAREVERFIFRPGLQDRARYYAVVFLNQLPLSHKESEGGPQLAKKLIEIYCTLFRLVVEGTMGRAADTRKAQEDRYRKDRAAYLRAKHKRQEEKAAGSKAGGAHADANAGVKGKAKPLKKPKKPELAVPEEMDARLLSALITGVRRAFPYVNQQEIEPVLEQQSQQMFRLVHTAPFPVGVQALMLLWQVQSTKESVSDRFYRALYSSLSHDALPTSTKAAMFLGLLFKAMKADSSSKRCAAFAKRLLQCTSTASAAFACAALLLLSEVLKAQPALWTGILQPEDAAGGATISGSTQLNGMQDDDGDEVFRDVADSEDEGQEPGPMQMADGNDRSAASQGHRANGKAGEQAAAHNWPRPGYYDINKREPMYALAERACWWELSVLGTHTHPSVAAFARTLLAGQHIAYTGDPLKDHALVTFLDKFIAKKPKAKLHGASLMQPVTATAAAQCKETALGVSSDVFEALAETQVKPDEVFFHRFYNLQAVRAKREAAKAEKKARKGKKGEDESEEGSEPDEGLGDELDDAEVDAFMDKEEGGVDDMLGDPDIGYDYKGLMKAMEDDPELRGPDDQDTDDIDIDDVPVGSDAESDEDGGGEEEEGDVADSDGEGEEEGDSELEDSGDDADEEFVMADDALLTKRKQQHKQHQSKGSKQAKQRSTAADDSSSDDESGNNDDTADEDLDGLGVPIMDLPSPSESGSGSEDEDMDDNAGPHHKRTKHKMQEHSFDFSDDEADDEQGQGGGSDEEGEGEDSDEHGAGMDFGEGEDDDEDDDALQGLLEDQDVSDEEDGEEQEEEEGRGDGKGKKSAGSNKRKQSLFASADDYADLLEQFEQRAKEQQDKEGGEDLNKQPQKRFKGHQQLSGKQQLRAAQMPNGRAAAGKSAGKQHRRGGGRR